MRHLQPVKITLNTLCGLCGGNIFDHGSNAYAYLNRALCEGCMKQACLRCHFLLKDHAAGGKCLFSASLYWSRYR